MTSVQEVITRQVHGTRMSADTPTNGADGPSGRDDCCSLCEKARGNGGRFVTCYPADGRTLPSRADDDGTLGLCADCTAEVGELVEAWSGHDAPPVGADWSLHAGFGRAAEDCSFCDGPLSDGPVLGVEYFGEDAARGRAGGTTTNYSLCDGCTSIFAEFLAVVGDDNV
jgi:hypothetical protein